MNLLPTTTRPLAFLLLCLALLLSLVSLPAHAKRVALVLGNGDYSSESKLANPVNDARLMARTLRELGFSVEEKTNLSKRDMELALARFVREAAGADSAVLFYAGHGAQPLKGGRNYLLPVDAKVSGDDTLEADGIAADKVVEQLESGANPARLRLVILDACRNNRLSGSGRSSVRGLARMTPGDDQTLIAFSTNDQDVAQDGMGQVNSPYTQALARYLGLANELPLRRIFELTAEDVRKATRQQQKPRTYGDLDSRMRLDGTPMVTQPTSLASVAPVPTGQPVQAPAQLDPEQEAWELTKRRDTVAAYQAYLRRYPQGRYANSAQVALEGLQPATAPTTVSAATPAAASTRPATVAPPTQSAQTTSPPITVTQPAPSTTAATTLNGRYQILAGGAEVKDLKTGLVWQRCSVGQQWNGQTCAGEASTFTFGKAQTLTRNGWRVPGKDELTSLVDKAAGKPTIHAQAFPATPATWFWTSTSEVNFSTASYVGFNDGNGGNGGRAGYGPVRLVR